MRITKGKHEGYNMPCVRVIYGTYLSGMSNKCEPITRTYENATYELYDDGIIVYSLNDSGVILAEYAKFDAVEMFEGRRS